MRWKSPYRASSSSSHGFDAASEVIKKGERDQPPARRLRGSKLSLAINDQLLGEYDDIDFTAGDVVWLPALSARPAWISIR